MKDAKRRATEDIIDDVLRRVVEARTVVDTAMAQAIARAVRHEWAGDTARICYIARRDDEMRTRRNTAIQRDYLAGERIALLSRRYGMSERQVMRIVKAGDLDGSLGGGLATG